MTIPKVPELPKQFNIDTGFPDISIDSLINKVREKTKNLSVLNTSIPSELYNRFNSDLPLTGIPLKHVLNELVDLAAYYHRRNDHPGCWAYISSSGLPTEPLAYALTALLNQNVTGYHSSPAASVIEKIVIDWILKLSGMPAGSGGILQSGGSIANLSALTVARDKALATGMHVRNTNYRPELILIVAETVHFSVMRAAKILGIDSFNVKKVKVNDDQKMCIDTLKNVLNSTLKDKNCKVMAVVATAGTTATGAVDPLNEVAEICKEHDVWMHVDAAYGGAALLSADLHGRLNGIQHADSIIIDFHKWCYISVECSVLLYRNPELARETFAVQADYVLEQNNAPRDDIVFFDLSPELSRRSRALSVWLAFHHYGIDIIGRNILHNVECAEYICSLVEATPHLELIAAPQLSVCCFRYFPEDRTMSEDDIDALNIAILDRINKSGNFLLSPTRVKGSFVLRVCIRSYKTRAAHAENFVKQVSKIGRSILE